MMRAIVREQRIRTHADRHAILFHSHHVDLP